MTFATYDRLLGQSFLHNVEIAPTYDHDGTRSSTVWRAWSDRTNARATYAVTRTSCSCPGFQKWSRCHHNSRLLFELHEEPQPTAEPVALTG